MKREAVVAALVQSKGKINLAINLLKDSAKPVRTKAAKSVGTKPVGTKAKGADSKWKGSGGKKKR